MSRFKTIGFVCHTNPRTDHANVHFTPDFISVTCTQQDLCVMREATVAMSPSKAIMVAEAILEYYREIGYGKETDKSG